MHRRLAVRFFILPVTLTQMRVTFHYVTLNEASTRYNITIYVSAVFFEVGAVLYQKVIFLSKLSTLYTSRTIARFNKGLLNNIVRFFLYKNFKAYYPALVPTFSIVALWHCFSC